MCDLKGKTRSLAMKMASLEEREIAFVKQGHGTPHFGLLSQVSGPNEMSRARRNRRRTDLLGNARLISSRNIYPHNDISKSDNSQADGGGERRGGRNGRKEGGREGE